MILPGTYANGFAPRDGEPLFPELWKGCVGAWNPGLGPTGNVLRDWSGKSQHGDLVNGPVWNRVAGHYAIEFARGGSQRVASTVKASFTALSFSFWIMEPSPEGGLIQYAIGMKAGGVDRLQIAVGNIYEDSTIAARSIFLYDLAASTGSSAVANSFSDANDAGKLRHIAVTYSSGGITAIYKDGTSLAMLSQTVSGVQECDTLFMGNRTDLVLSMGGMLVDVRLYDRILTSGETKLLGLRPGIAHELAPVRYAGESAASYRRRLQAAQIIGGGMI